MDKIFDHWPKAVSTTQVSADPAMVMVRKFTGHWLELRASGREKEADFQLKRVKEFVERDTGGRVKYPFENESSIAGWIQEQPDTVFRYTGLRFNRKYSSTSRYTVDEEQFQRIEAGVLEDELKKE
jgi:hypothetical protein